MDVAAGQLGLCIQYTFQCLTLLILNLPTLYVFYVHPEPETYITGIPICVCMLLGKFKYTFNGIGVYDWLNT